MHPLHDYVSKQLAEKLKSRKVVIWYDVRGAFAPFVAELRSGTASGNEPIEVYCAGIPAHLTEYSGSFFELRSRVESFVRDDTPAAVIIYVRGIERDRHGSVLMEVEKAGDCYEPQLRRLARNVLRQQYTDGVIDEMLAAESVTYEDLARAASNTTSPALPSRLKLVFKEQSTSNEMLAAWLAREALDADIAEKEAVPELQKLIHSRIGLELPDDASLEKLRSITLRYVLGGEFLADLRSAPLVTLEGLARPNSKDEEAAVREIAKRLRSAYSEQYASLADRVENELGLGHASIPPHALGSIDTFRFEERSLLSYCGELIANQRFDEALALVEEHESNFWLDHDVSRKAQWEACRRMAEVGNVAVAIRAAVVNTNGDLKSWVIAYTEREGWYRLDHFQRRLESWVANLEDDPDERALGVVRRAYEDTCYQMAQGFTKAVVNANWNMAVALHQTKIYSEVIASRPKPVAYFLVDAMRFEMGVELAERLPKAAEVSVRPAIATVPSITPIGMAALLPGASSSFSVVEQGEKLGARIENVFLPDLAARKKSAAAKIPQLVDLTLDELLSLQPSKLAKKLDGAQIIIVRSQEIDHAGEAGFTFQARQVMDTVIDNLSRAIRKLAAAGIENSVVTADHGHLFFPVDRDESMRTDAPGGRTVELHRRCWIGHGGTTPTGCIRVGAAALGYTSDLEFVFPVGCGVFKAGGDLAFHHGGLSLQEMIVPVLTVRLQVKQTPTSKQPPVDVSGIPTAVTTRMVTVEVRTMFDAKFKPVLVSKGREVGKIFGAVGDATIDAEQGDVSMASGTRATLALRLTDDSILELRMVFVDPATDAELWASPVIPVRLGV